MKLTLLILWEGQRGSLNNGRIDTEGTSAGVDSSTPVSDLK